MTTVTTENIPSGLEIIEKLGRVLPQWKHRFTPQQPLSDLNFDSLDRVELLCVIESELSVQINEQDLTAAATVGELADFISERLYRDTGLRPVRVACEAKNF
jgi:acyl carrier protein